MQLINPRPARPMPIRLTPLIDVVFILLVFFMLTTHLAPTDHLNLENTTAKAASVTGQPLPEVTLTTTGELQWQGQLWTPKALAGGLSQQGLDKVNLVSGGEVELAKFTGALGTLSAAGIEARWKRTPPPAGER
ncbi:MAG: biopolymer transporter ExbD [Oleiphilaceae bacterium]|nr:biopolymer transporter ExbD [Oleiphilaceae bacterium]